MEQILLWCLEYTKFTQQTNIYLMFNMKQIPGWLPDSIIDLWNENVFMVWKLNENKTDNNMVCVGVFCFSYDVEQPSAKPCPGE